MSAGRTACALLAACLLTTLAACGVAPTSAPTPTPALSDAPRVPAPRDLTGIPACQLLTPDQLRQFRFDPADLRTEHQDTTDRCQYTRPDYLLSGSLTSAYRWQPGGLDRLYLTREFAEVFIPGTLDGFPTLLDTLEDADFCELSVGVADDQLLLVRASTLSRYRGPPACEVARSMASAVLSNLPPLR